MIQYITTFFFLKERNTTIQTECLAGITNWLSMLYLMALNPFFLATMGVPFVIGVISSIIITAIATGIMGVVANHPFCVGPAIGISAFAAYTLHIDMGLSLSAILAASLLVGSSLIFLNVTKIRLKMIQAIPKDVLSSITSAIGLFLLIVGLRFADVSIHSIITLEFETILPLTATFAAYILLKRDFHLSFICVILTSWLLFAFFGDQNTQRTIYSPSSIVLHIPRLAEVIKAYIPLMAITVIDSTAGLLSLGSFLYKGSLPRLQKTLIADAIGSTISPLTGGLPLAIHMESLSGIQAGGRTGLTALITSLLFIPTLFLYPYIINIPKAATAPVLLCIGILMLEKLYLVYKAPWIEIVSVALTCLTVLATTSIFMGFCIAFVPSSLLYIYRYFKR